MQNGDEGYYFKISNDILDKYIEESYKAEQRDKKDIFPDYGENEYEESMYDLKEYIEEGYKGDENEYEESQYDLNEYIDKEYDEEEEEKTRKSIEDWFKTKDFKEYFIKMIRAEIASSYPKLGDYTGEAGTEDKQNNKKDKHGDYVAQGMVQIHRQKMDEAGTVEAEKELTYIPYKSDNPNEKTLKGLINANDIEALEHFSFDEKTGQIYYATYKRVVVTVNGVEAPDRSSYEIVENPPVSYKNLTAMCSMPYSFLFALLQTSQNPEYVMKVADLLLEKSTVILMIQDQLNINEYIEVNRQVEKIETQEAKGFARTVAEGNTITTEEYWVYGATETSYEFPAGETETVVSTTYENTVNMYIKKAETWCMDFEQEATQNPPKETQGEPVEVEHNESEYEGLTYPSEPTESNEDSMPSPTAGATFTLIEKFLSDEKLTYTIQSNIKNYTWTVSASTPKKINYERFVGLWKNDRGEYYDGCLFDENNPNQKDVSYPTPEDERKLDVVVDNIADHQGQTIEDLTDLLAVNGLEAHERLMKYFWNKYYGEDIYEVDIEELLDLFDKISFTEVSGVSYGTLQIRSDDIKITKAEFLEAMNNKFASTGRSADFSGEGAETIWDVCIKNGLNPILCVAQACLEQGWTEARSNHNYWGIGVYDETMTGESRGTIEEGIQLWCNVVKNRFLNTNSDNYKETVSLDLKQFSSKFSGNMTTAHDLAFKWADYGESTRHDVFSYGHTIREWIGIWGGVDCTHADSDYITPEERAAKARNYGDTVTQNATEIFGSVALGGGGVSELADWTVSDGVHTYPHYNQNADEMATIKWGHRGGGRSVKSSGCGAVSAAMILSGYLDDPSIDIYSIMEKLEEYYKSTGIDYDNSGLSFSLWRVGSFFQDTYRSKIEIA